MRTITSGKCYTIYDEIGRASNGRAHVFSRFLAMFEVDFWCIHAKGKQTREMDTALSKLDQS